MSSSFDPTAPRLASGPPLPLLITFVPGTSLLLERDRPSQFPIHRNGPPGTFVMFADGMRISLPTDQIVFTDDTPGHAVVGFGGMAFASADDGQLVFKRVRELHREQELSPARSHTMILQCAWVASVEAAGRLVWPSYGLSPG